MIKERELLTLVLSYAENLYLTVDDFEMINEIEETFKNIKEFLAQPEQTEQEPVAWKVIDETNDGAFMFSEVKPMERYYKDYVVIPLYTSPPKREPLSDGTTADMYHANKKATHADSYWTGVYDAEKAHGIGE